MKQTENPDNWISSQDPYLTEQDQKRRFCESYITSTREINPSFDSKSISNNRRPYTLTLNNHKSWPALIAYNLQNLDPSKSVVLL